MRLPTQFRLRRLILDVLSERRDAVSEESQDAIARRLRLTRAQLAVRAGAGYERFKNDHAFALVTLSQRGYIEKRGRRGGRDTYMLTAQGRTFLRRAGETIPDGKASWKDVDPLYAAEAIRETGLSATQSPSASGTRSGVRVSARADIPDEIQDAFETLEAIAGTAGLTRSPQGWRVSLAERRAIERHAMWLASEFFQARGYRVEDVSATKPYDLVCTRGSIEKRVEVKGTTTGGVGVFLTAGEVDHAIAFDDVALFVVTDIELNTRGAEPLCAGGTEFVLDPWRVKRTDQTLRPVMYRYELPDPND